MELYVIRRDDGKFVTQGGESSYTAYLQEARTFSSREAAQPHKCGNETILPVSQCMREPDDSLR